MTRGVTGAAISLFIVGMGAAKAGASETKRRPVVACYVETLFDGVTAGSLDLSGCTMVIEAFAAVDESGAVTARNGIARRALIRSARARSAKVLVSIGGSTVAAETFTRIAQSAPVRARFYQGLSELMSTWKAGWAARG